MTDAPGFLIRKLHLESFGSVNNATVDLEPLTVFVGPNDSGKSMLLRGLTTLAQASTVSKGWRDVYPDANSLIAQTFHGRSDSVKLALSGQLGSEPFDYEVSVSAAPGYSMVQAERAQVGAYSVERNHPKFSFKGLEGKQFEHDVPDGTLPLPHQGYLLGGHLRTLPGVAEYFAALSPLLRAIRAIRFYSLRPESIRFPTPPGTPLWTDGSGLPTAIADLLLRDRDTMDRIEHALAAAMPQVKRVAIVQHHTGTGLQYGIELITRSGARVPSQNISDGVLLYLGYLYLVLGAQPASVLLIEEPETGIHFGLLRSVMKLLRDLTTGAHGGPPTQILITTHSPMLLNLVEPHEIRVVQRGDDGETRVSRFTDAPGLEKLLDYQGPGEIWVNQGEDYLTQRKAPQS